MRYRESCQTATEVMLLQRPKKNLSQMEWSGVCTGSTSWSLFLRSGCSHSGWPWNGALLDHFFGHLKGVVQDCSTTERPLKRKQLLGPVFLWFWLARKQPWAVRQMCPLGWASGEWSGTAPRLFQKSCLIRVRGQCLIWIVKPSLWIMIQVPDKGYCKKKMFLKLIEFTMN